MAEYTASGPVYVDGVYVEAGRKFTTDQPKGSTWVEVKKPRDPLDHDGDGRKGGAVEPERKTLSLPK